MSYSENNLPRSKALMRGKMLVAWFAEATPPVLWRFVAGDVSGGFSLRHGDGKVDLLAFDGSPAPQVIASFTSEASAERALARLSQAVLSYKAPWKKVVKVISAIILLFLLITAMRLYQNNETLRAISSLQGLGAGRPTAAARPTPSPLLPGMGVAPAQQAAAPPAPPTGSPIDVDKFYK